MNLDATPHTGSELALSLQPHLVGVHATPVLGITTMGGQSRSEGGGLPLLLSKDAPHLEKHLPRAQQGLQFLFAPLCHLTGMSLGWSCTEVFALGLLPVPIL